MNKREEALLEGLLRNEEETERWTKYEQELKQASENLITFSKKLSVNVMIPIGTKALIPGNLIHTNDTFVNHYGKLFSNCSAYQAGKICKYRIKMAKERIEKLNEERDMFQNKLEKPYLNGVLPNSNDHEIIEEYDEEKEKLWREEHRKNIKHLKLKEKEERNILNVRTDKEIFDMLEDFELMDELEEDLDGLNVEDSEIIQKLMSGEIKVKEKERITHYNNHNVIFEDQEINETSTRNDSDSDFPILNNLYKKYNTSNGLNKVIDYTNNNSIPNTDFEIANNDLSSTSIIDFENDDLPKEILQMEEDMINLSHYKKIKYLTKKIKQYERNFDKIKIKNEDLLNDKMYKLDILNYLYDHLQILEDDSTESDSEDTEVNNDISTKKKKISFAAHDDIQIINKDDKVSDMLKSSKRQDFKRDIIKLDDDFVHDNDKNLNIQEKDEIIDKKKIIKERVENNIKYAYQNQNHSDFDLIGKILVSASSKTLEIKFKHSSQSCLPVNESSIDRADNLINSPSDIYKIFADSDNFNGEFTYPQNNVDKNANAYEDIRTKFSIPSKNVLSDDKKSILKNKDAVNGEIRLNKPKKSKVKKLENASLTAFDIVMGDVVEKPVIEPDSLPKEQFVDSRAPRKRISRFKQSRT